MKPWRTREELVSQTTSLARTGMSVRAISRALQVNRATVRKLLAAHHAARDEIAEDALPRTPVRAPRTTKLDDHHPRVAELLERYPDITAQRVFEELSAAGYEGGYTAVKDYVRRVRPPAHPKPSLPTPTYGPAEMAESDWSPYMINFTHAPRARVQAFSYVLPYSTRKHFDLYRRCDLHALMDGHVTTFERFGGAAHACKYDSQKPVVLGWEGNQPIYNPRYLAFCAHYEFRPVACRRRKPNDKPRVERSFWEFERSFLNGRSFRDQDDMRAQLLAWEDDTADPRPPKRSSERSRMDRFADERPLLRPLPRHPYDTARVIYRLCSIDGFIAWDGNRYVVPYQHITDILPVRVTQRELFVYAASFECVARHELVACSAGQDTGADRYHPNPWRSADHRPGADLDQLRLAFAAMDEGAVGFLDALCGAAPRHATYHARRILLLREHFRTDDLCAALRHALDYGAYDHQAIERILTARSTPRRLAEYVAEDLAQKLGGGPGARASGAPDLTHYDRLPPTGGQAPRDEEQQPCRDADPRQDPPTTCSTDSDEPSTSSD